MNRAEKSPKLIASMHLFPIFAVLILVGCTGKAVKVEFPIDHPANPDAVEAEFIPPHNPFQTDVALTESETKTDSKKMHKMPGAGVQQHGGHNMEGGKENQSDSESMRKPDHGDDNDLRMEGHSQ